MGLPNTFNTDAIQKVAKLDEMASWEVHKFGGTSVASAKCLLDVASIIESLLDSDGPVKKHIAVVVSAMGAQKPLIKTTDLLLHSVEHAAKRDWDAVESCLSQLRTKHLDCLQQINLPSMEQERLSNLITQDLEDIRDILKTVSLMKWQASRISELVSGYGELWSAQILTSLLQLRRQSDDTKSSMTDQFIYLDARRVITVEEDEDSNDKHQSSYICWKSSDAKLQTLLKEQQPQDENHTLHFVVTGYVAINTQGVATTLSRDGSDYSAAIVGRLLHASSISIWTDVDGVLSADPRRVPDAHVIPEVSYTEAMELAYFGAKVIHPKTMQPAIEHSYFDTYDNSAPDTDAIENMQLSPIPIWIRNTFNPNHPGSRIYTTSTTHTERDKCVCGFSTMDEMALVNIEGTGMMGVHGVASRLFATLQRVKINVVLISQASSEHSITFACSNKNNQALVAQKAIEETFHRELKLRHMNAIEVLTPCSIIAAVGDGMSHTTGVSGLFFGALGDARINILAISQGCSERNISAVIHSMDSTRALRAVHAAFRLSHAVVRVGIVTDIGHHQNNQHAEGKTLPHISLGQSLLEILEKQRSKIREMFDIDLQVCVVCEASTVETTSAEKKLKRHHAYRLLVLDPESKGGKYYSPSSVSMERHDSITPLDFAKHLELAKSPSRCETDCTQINEKKADITDHSVSFVNVAETENSSGVEAYNVLSRQLLKHLVSADYPYTVMFDCTANEEVANQHPTWLAAGVHVVTANSLGLSGSTELRKAIDSASKGKLSANYLREVTAAGALPVISTLRDLLHSGDRVRRIDGILSVSLSYILHRIAPPPGLHQCEVFDQTFRPASAHYEKIYSNGHSPPGESSSDSIFTHHNELSSPNSTVTLSQAVKEAVALGLMENDPLKDLSNEYVARILMVLAKELGIDLTNISVEQIQLESDMILAGVEKVDIKVGGNNNIKSGGVRKKSIDGIEEFDKVSAELDRKMSERVAKATQKGCVPRHVASIDVDTREFKIKLLDVPQTHLFATTPPTCAVVRFFTERHDRYPLVVQGPAEGIPSTASALLAELLQMLKAKVAPKGGTLARANPSGSEFHKLALQEGA